MQEGSSNAGIIMDNHYAASDSIKNCRLNSDKMENTTLHQYYCVSDTYMTHTDTYTDLDAENVFIALRCIVAIMTMFGNSLTILIIVRYRKLHTSSNVLIVSLAVADFITGLCTAFMFGDIFIKR